MKKSARCFLFLFASFFPAALFADAPASDSLIRAWIRKGDTVSINLICSQCEILGSDSVESYGNSALRLSEKLGYKRGEARANLVLGQHEYHKEFFSKSLDHCIRAFALAKEIGDNSILASACLYIGYNHFLNEPKTSMDFYQKGLEFCRLAKDTLRESYFYSAMGNLYEGWGDGVGALEFYSRSLAIREKAGSPDQLVSSILETARAFGRMEQYDKKKELVLKGLQIAEEKGKNDQNLVYLYQMMGYDIADRQKDYRAALEYFLKSYELVRKMDAFDNNNINSIRPVADMYLKLGDFKNSSEYFKMYFDMQEANQRKLDKELYESQFSLKREIEKQELLQKDAEILRQRVEIQKQSNLRNLFIAGSLVVLAISFFLYRNYRMNKRQSLLLEEKVKEKTAQLTEVNRELEAFIYKASHDLKGPLVSSRSLVNMVKEEKEPAEIMKYIDMIQLSLGKLDNILLSLHEVAVIRQGNIVKTNLNIPYEISQLLKSFEGLPNFDKIQVSVKDIARKEFSTDKILMHTILRNVLENAIKYYNPRIPEPKIDISIEEKSGWNVIRISDNGIGIAKEHQAKVFDMFFRATDSSKGSGLGLYIVKSAADKLKGKVEIESEEGKGTTFTLYFPQ